MVLVLVFASQRLWVTLGVGNHVEEEASGNSPTKPLACAKSKLSESSIPELGYPEKSGEM